MKPRHLLAEGELSSEPVRGERLRTIIIPFIIFTAIWGSTWIVIRGQLGMVPPQWSVAYRFAIAAVAMAIVAGGKGDSLRLDCTGLAGGLVLGVFPVCGDLNRGFVGGRDITIRGGGTGV